MRLLTRLVPLGNRTSVDYRNAGDAAHDLLAAHALLQAMREFHPSNEAARASFDLAKKRAAEILAGWLGEDSQRSGQDGL